MDHNINSLFDNMISSWAAGIQAAAAPAEKDQKDQGKNSRNGE